MTLSLELLVSKNNAIPNNVDENKVRAVVKYNNKPVRGENVNFYVTDYLPHARFKNGTGVFIGVTNRDGEVDASIISSTNQKVVVVATILNGDSPPISRSTIVSFGVSSEKKDLTNTYPIVVEAIGKDKSFLERSTYYRLPTLNVVVPSYKGMDFGDKLTLHWSSNITSIKYETNYQLVLSQKNHNFNLPRYLFIDCIGGSARVFFTVEDKDGKVYSSDSVNLVVEGQPYDIIAPMVIPGSHKVNVSYRGMHAGQTVKIRIWNVVDSAIVGIYKSETKQLTSSRSVVFDIPYPWLDTNTRGGVIINYSVRDSRHKHFQFSRALELKGYAG